MNRSIRSLSFAVLVLTLSACGGGETSAEHLDRARTFLASGENESALIELKNAVQKDNASAEARYLLGQLQLKLGNTPAAEKELLSARKLGWAPADVTPALAQALLAQGKYAQIRDLETDPLDNAAKARVKAVQALSELAQGENEAARELIDEARAAAPESPEVMVASARIDATEGDFGSAAQTLEQVLASDPSDSDAWNLLGDVRMRQGEPEEAIAAYNETLARQPDNFSARLRRAQIEMKRSNFDAARADAAILIEQAPRNPGSNYVQGLVQFQGEEYADAISSLTQAEPAFRQFPMVLYYLGSAHLIEGNAALAESFADRFVSVAPENIAGRKLLATLRLERGDYDDVQRLLEPILDRFPEDIGALNLMANALIKDGKTDEGLTLLSKLAELQPDSAQAQVRLGAGMLLTGDNSQAVHHIESALDLNPEFQQADILLVLNHLRREEYDSAIKAARAYASRNPASVTPYNLLGRVYLAAGDEAEARKSFDRALLIDEGDLSANHNLAQLYLAENDPDSARQRYEAVLAVHKDSLPALLQLARLEAGAGNEEATVARLQRALTAHPTAIEPRLMLGRYYIAKGRPAQVAPLFTTLDRVQQQSPEVLRLMAVAQLSGREPEKAQRTLQQLLETTPDSAAVHHMLARAAADAGDREQAERELRRTLELAPDHLVSRIALARLELAAGSKEGFEQQLEILVAQAPDNINVLQLQAQDASRRDDFGAAADYARRAYELAPSEKTLLALSTYEQSAGRSDTAITRLRAWLGDNPQSVPVRLALAIALGSSDQRDASLAEYRKILKSDPDSFLALNNLAWETRETNPGESLDYARRATSLNPENAAALDTLAVVEFINGDYRSAKRSILRALERAPGIPSLLYHDAMIDNALGDKDSAIATLRQLLEDTTDFPEYAEARDLLATLSQ